MQTPQKIIFYCSFYALFLFTPKQHQPLKKESNDATIASINEVSTVKDAEVLESSLVEVDRIEAESEEAVSQIPNPDLEKKKSTDGINVDSEIVNETIRQIDGADEVHHSDEIVTNNNTISTEDYIQDSEKPLAK